MRILHYAFRNIIRNPLLSISSIFVITLLIFFVNILLGVLYTSERFIDGVNDRISFTVSFQSGYTVSDVRVRTLADTLQTAFTGIAIETISKKQAFSLLKERNPDLTALIENSGENPLPDSLRIDNIPLDDYSRFNEIISAEKDILFYDKDSLDRKYLDYQSQFQRVALVVKLLSTLSYGVYALLGLFIFTVAVIIYMVIGNSIFFHKQEIEIIELVG
jgi:cell division transport system permease protein